MNLESFRDYCLSHREVTEGFPFGEGALVFKVAGKMFALASLDGLPPSVNLKCDPDRAVDLRERYSSVLPGYHMNKKHWNTVLLDGSIDDGEIREMIDHSYELVVSGLSRKDRERIGMQA